MHLSSGELVPGLPPVGTFDETVRWRSQRTPVSARHRLVSIVEPCPDANASVAYLSGLDNAGRDRRPPEPGGRVKTIERGLSGPVRQPRHGSGEPNPQDFMFNQAPRRWLPASAPTS